MAFGQGDGTGVGAYLDAHVRPVVVEHAGDERLWRWQRYLAQDAYRTRSSRFAMRLAFFMLIPAVPALGLVWAAPALHSWWAWTVWSAGVLVLVASMATWLKESRGVEWI